MNVNDLTISEWPHGLHMAGRKYFIWLGGGVPEGRFVRYNNCINRSDGTVIIPALIFYREDVPTGQPLNQILPIDSGKASEPATTQRFRKA